jgi:tetratricopeptide (TPR) repeat protein
MRELLSKRLPFVGRDRERALFSQAVAGVGRPVLLIMGDAGIGKTLLLEEAGRIAQEQAAFCPPVVDFYDTSMHSHQGLEAAIAQGLDPIGEAFGEYWAQRQRDPQADLWGPFLAGYKAALGDRRAVLRFDTAERLEYERDSQEVIDDCDVRELDAPSWEWLLKRIGNLPQTTILIAARPTQTGLLRRRLLEAHGDRALVLEVTGFAPEETDAYFRATEFGRQVADKSSEMVAKIHLLADGRPILIALALDWLKRGMWDPRLYPVGVAELRARKTQAQAEEEADQHGEEWQQWRETRQRFEAALVEQIRRLATPLDIAVRYVALCRKGCNAALLSHLMGIDEGEAAKLIEELLTLSFVKLPRSGSHGLFFLHDEMYDLVEKYVWQVEWLDYREQTRLDGVIIGWYDEQIENLREQIKTSRNRRARVDLRRQQQLLMAERLYYQFDANPREGYGDYTRMDEEAIAAQEMEWDVLLRNEALWFTAHRGWRIVERGPTRRRNRRIERSPWVDHDCRRRWVSRYIARQEWDKAIRIAEKLLRKAPLPEEPELYRPGLHIALASAQAYKGGEFIEPALRHFEEGIQGVQTATETSPPEHQNLWRSNHLLGQAYLYQGLALRSTPRLPDAAKSYRQAAYCFRQNNYQAGLAEALNNLAYVYARQGKPERAMDPCDKALAIREELGDEYPIGLSLNTKGIIYERHGFPETAIRFSRQAFDIFQRIGNERGMVLAEINLGRSYRRKGRSQEWHARDDAGNFEDTDFREGQGLLEKAISSLESWGGDREVFYEVEAYDELGCLYRDWVAALYEYAGRRDCEQLVPLLEQGIRNLEHARSLLRDNGAVPARNALLYVDVTEDLARVYYWRARVTNEAVWWDKALELLKEAIAVTDHWISPQPESWFLKGKIHHQYARIAEERKEWGLTAEHYARAAGLLEKFSPHTPELRKTVSGATRWLSSFGSKEEAERQIETMKATLRDESLTSPRLQEWIDDTVLPHVGAGWL